jgi:hypothetical protein
MTPGKMLDLAKSRGGEFALLCSGTEFGEYKPIVEAKDTLLKIKDMKLSNNNYITTFSIFSQEGKPLPNCDILNYNLAGKNSIVINVSKSGCSVN